MSNQAVDVEILGKITRVNCPPGQEDSLIQAAKELDNRLKEMAERTKVTNEVKLLTIAALNICYELQSQIKENQQTTSNLATRMELLSTSLDQVIHQVEQEKS
ncbi:cell division protein ZapA [Vibrio gazogenes]|uniref:Cell division protein ZapA n=1 Tax=Vibrio gazogenes DSM 21264 = NBRC 103151 TaxID=1123492 RepID=A0A1M5CR71_VIBGA|nr:cell division protein ZapA [Vibrio gazogenes]USP14158.1 cell division protein ZapA [Vibrio gazogenes]SHF57230.1 cell division protein ZapA [Vibrio gazogenes DSM 21264] [Vibrio gazogenes DSM 21264 = NBRC 103151]